MKKRIVYFDVLKVITCFMVIMIHVISRNWYVLDLKSNEFTFLTILDSICRCAVPIYLMISGAIFLNEDKNIKIKDMFRKYILNIFLIYLFWNMTYSILNIIVYGNKIINVKVLKDIFISTILGNGIFHLKFLVTIIGFYLCVPFVRCITKKENKNLYSKKNENITSGKCGEKIRYTLSKAGVLTLRGKGETYSYHSNKKTPWHKYSDLIKIVKVEKGITGLGNQLFKECGAIQQVSLPKELQNIGDRTFYGAVFLKRVELQKKTKYNKSTSFSGKTIVIRK